MTGQSNLTKRFGNQHNDVALSNKTFTRHSQNYLKTLFLVFRVKSVKTDVHIYSKKNNTNLL
jgi:hypothetical protein